MKPPTAKDRILQALEAGQFTSRQLAKMLNISLGTVPATMSQLRDAKKVESCGISINDKNRVQSIIWRKV